MKPLFSALLIPETEPSVHDIGNLLLFFDSLSYYLPTESDSAETSEPGLLKKLCTGYAPAPLGEDLNRFNRLLQELENSRSDDLARLFASAKSPIATGEIRDRDETSTGDVLAALHMDNSKLSHIQYKERLWQARLILKLAEILDRREHEVRRGLAHISSEEQKVISSLDGIKEPEHADPEQSSDLEQLSRLTGRIEYPEAYSTGASATLISLRLKAWTELFLADPSPDRPFILVAPNSDYGSSILDGYENIWRKTPQKLFSLSIPSIPGLGSNSSASEQFFSWRNKLRLTLHEHLEYFGIFLKNTASPDKEMELAMLPEHVTAWEEIIKIEFPGPATENQKLDFYCFPGIPPEDLLQRLFHLEPVLAANKPRYTASILAVRQV